MLWKEVMEYIGDDNGLTWKETEQKLAPLFEKMADIMDISIDSAKKTFYDVANVNISLVADLARRYLEMERHHDALKLTAKHIIEHAFVGNKTGSC